MVPHSPIPGMFRISVPTPYAVGPMNCYVIDGPEPALIDCGPPTRDGEEALRAGLRALRLRPSDLAQIVLTHHHADHSGGLSWLRGETGAPLLGHAANDLWLRGGARMLEKRLRFFTAFYRYCGVDRDTAKDLRRGMVVYEDLAGGRGIDRALGEGVFLELAGVSWRVLETPGHAGTQIGLLREDGVFLGGDTLLERISSNALVEPPYGGATRRQSSLLAYRSTLRRLHAEPIGLVLPGHGNQFDGAAQLIERRLAAQEERARRLLSHIRSGRRTVCSLSEALFPGLRDDQTFLGLSEVVGRLDLLEQQGAVAHSGYAPARYHLVE